MITSAANPRLKLVRRLASRAQRSRTGLFVCEGEDLLAAAREQGIEPVDVLVAGEDVDPTLLADASTLGHAARVIAIFRRDALPGGTRGTGAGLALWRVADPGNVGTLLRTVDAFDGACVALSAGSADPVGAKALRASAGAIFRVPLLGFDDAPRPWLALATRGGRPLPEAELGDDATFVLGAERVGLPPDVLAACDDVLSIPLATAAESLNVAVAGAVALWEWRRQMFTEAGRRERALHERDADA